MPIVSPSHAHVALFLPIRTERHAGEHSGLFKRPVVLVAVKIIWAGVVGHVQIGPAVVVVVAPNRPQAVVVVGIVHAGFFRNFFKRPVSAVVEKQVGFPLHPPRTALHSNSLEPAGLFVAAESWQLVQYQNAHSVRQTD